MKVRTIVILTASVSLLVPAAMLAQTPAAAKPAASDKSYTPPRGPDGHASLEGIWTNGTVTPFERPAQFANKPYLTAEEAAAFAKQRVDQGNVERIDRPPGPDDLAHRAYNQEWSDRGTQVVKTMRTSLVIDPPDGHVPPMTPAAKKKFDEAHSYAEAHPADGPEDRPLSERCIIFSNTGPPMLPDGYNTNYQIVQEGSYIAVLSEMPHALRTIPLDGRPHLPKDIRQWQGDPRGHWDGDTLVVDTTNFEYNDKTRFGIMYDGMTDQNLHITERFTRTGPDTILYRATIDDPTVYTKPWTLEVPLSRQQNPMYEYACHEGNYAMTDILAGARADEAKAASK